MNLRQGKMSKGGLNEKPKGKRPVVNELEMRKKYESFLKSAHRSSELVEDYKTFEWFCKQ